jgi:hypothetical protein
MLIIDSISTNLVLASPCVFLSFLKRYGIGPLGTSNSELAPESQNIFNLVRLLGRETAYRKASTSTSTERHKNTIHRHRHLWHEWDSNPRSQCCRYQAPETAWRPWSAPLLYLNSLYRILILLRLSSFTFLFYIYQAVAIVGGLGGNSHPCNGDMHARCLPVIRHCARAVELEKVLESISNLKHISY